MQRELRSVRPIAAAIADAVDGAMATYRDNRVSEEPQLTDRILGAIEERLRKEERAGIVWRAKTLRTGRGVAAEEKRHGADVLGVLDIKIDSFETTKGFLAQAKMAEPGTLFTKREWHRLRDQCETMLSRTPDSFVFAYSRAKGMRIVPAIAVIGLRDGRDLFDLYHRGVAPFFESFIECFIGDPRLNSPKIETLDTLINFPVGYVLELQVRRK